MLVIITPLVDPYTWNKNSTAKTKAMTSGIQTLELALIPVVYNALSLTKLSQLHTYI